MKGILTIAAMAAALALAGCGGSDESNGGLTSEESAGLNNAADMLDASPDSLVANENVPLGNGEDSGDGAMGNMGTMDHNAM